MTRPALPSYLCMALVLAAGFLISGHDAQAIRLLDESFENFDDNGDPNGWQVAGHPSYIRCRNENEGDWTTPYGDWALQTYGGSGAPASKIVGTIPFSISEENDGSGDYIVEFSLSSFSAIGEYRAELWAIVPFYDEGPIFLGAVAGDTNGSKDMSYTDQIFWRYEYVNWPDPDFPGFGLLEGAQLQLKLMQDPNRSNWRHTPLWDNVTVDYIPDVDIVPPALLDITDDNQGGLVVATNATVTYTVTFNEAMNGATVNTDDFTNAGSAPVTIQSVTATTDPAVYTVAVSPTNVGTLRLGIAGSATLQDTAGNSLNTASGTTQDNVTFVVEAGTPTILPSDFVDDQSGDPIAENTLVIYTLTFSTNMNLATIQAGDFENAGTAPINIGSIAQPNPGEITIEVTPTDSGTLQFSIKEGVLIEAADGGELNTGSAILDDTIIIVDSDPPTVTDIVDDAEGAPVSVGALLTYEVYFSEDIDAATVDASDFGNAVSSGGASFTIDTVEEATPGTIRIEITPKSTGSIQLQINAGVTIEDVLGNALDTSSAIIDDVTVTVEAASADPFSTWSGGAAFGDDANSDGVPNGMAWLLGATDVNENARTLLPTASTNPSGDLVLSFRCLKTANRGGAIAKVQYSSDLGVSDPWTGNEAEVPDTNSTVNGIVFETTDAGDYVDVTATIPASAASPGGSLFGRFLGNLP